MLALYEVREHRPAHQCVHQPTRKISQVLFGAQTLGIAKIIGQLIEFDLQQPLHFLEIGGWADLKFKT